MGPLHPRVRNFNPPDPPGDTQPTEEHDPGVAPDTTPGVAGLTRAVHEQLTAFNARLLQGQENPWETLLPPHPPPTPTALTELTPEAQRELRRRGLRPDEGDGANAPTNPWTVTLHNLRVGGLYPAGTTGPTWIDPDAPVPAAGPATPIPAHPCRSCLRQRRRRGPHHTVRPLDCETCRRCTSCGCICQICPACNTRRSGTPAHVCRSCGRCRATCCTCRNSPHYLYPANLPILRNPGARANLFNPLPRSLGIEVELANWGTLTSHRFQSFTYRREFDRSVEPSQHEMVIPPMSGDYFLTAMSELATALHHSRATVNHTCGLHVHVGCSDLSYWEIRRLLILWNQLEPDIYSYLVAPWRSSTPTVTHFCQLLTRRHRPCEKCDAFNAQHPGHMHTPSLLPKLLKKLSTATTTTAIKHTLLAELYGIIPATPLTNAPPGQSARDARDFANTVLARKGGKYEYCRYFGLNLHSWMYRQTVEFRMKEGTTSLSDLIWWPLLCGYIVHSVTQASDATLASITGIEDFATRFCSPGVTSWVCDRISAVRGASSTPSAAPIPTL